MPPIRHVKPVRRNIDALSEASKFGSELECLDGNRSGFLQKSIDPVWSRISIGLPNRTWTTTTTPHVQASVFGANPTSDPPPTRQRQSSLSTSRYSPRILTSPEHPSATWIVQTAPAPDRVGPTAAESEATSEATPMPSSPAPL